ncbi:hypothetical protein CS022_17165 [Veronia nyctiphanis]|uniref:Uncharacterized protein n=1 Tax=Veronia nyctiphanis TaxID=1278244 RepID=A0A4Q0YP62_9GAMM|nr:HrpE/YscL family type III secretion apparatus protein [Veronia nyctiphanis]RXJ72275.1 hypothetical protein CS022_17165 [Veronia nyctiphanis]
MSSAFVSKSIHIDESVYPLSAGISVIKSEELIKLDTLATLESKAVKKVKTYASKLVDEHVKAAQADIQQQIEQGWQHINQWQADTLALRESYLANLEHSVVDIVNSVVGQLLNEATDQQKVASLVRQLAECKTAPAQGKLHCNPSRANAVRAALSSQRLMWEIASDPSLDVDALRLTSPNGEFTIDWQQAVELLFIDQSKLGL